MPTEHKMKLADSTVTLRRGIELKFSPTESGTGDHMTVQYFSGNADEVVVFSSGGATQVKRLVMHMDIQASSTPALPAMTGTHFSLENVDDDDEKRLLKIHEMVLANAA